MTWIFFIIDYKYKNDGGMKKGLNRFASLKFNGGMVDVFRFERNIQKVQCVQKVGNSNTKLQTTN